MGINARLKLLSLSPSSLFCIILTFTTNIFSPEIREKDKTSEITWNGRYRRKRSTPVLALSVGHYYYPIPPQRHHKFSLPPNSALLRNSPSFMIIHSIQFPSLRATEKFFYERLDIRVSKETMCKDNFISLPLAETNTYIEKLAFRNKTKACN